MPGAENRDFSPPSPPIARGPEEVTGWDPYTGAGLDRLGRETLRRVVPLSSLQRALARSEAFWDHVAQVATDEDAYNVAIAYGKGQLRRALIGRFLLLAARATDRTQAIRWLSLASTQSYWVNPADAEDQKPYALRPDYLERVTEGARAIARRGAHQCLSCGIRLSGGGRTSSGRRARREYCAGHEQDPLARWRTEAMRSLFEEAAKGFVIPLPSTLGLLPGAWESRDVWLEVRLSDALRLR